AKLGTDDNLVAHIAQRFVEDRLGIAGVVRIGSVEESDAGLEGTPQEIDPGSALLYPPPGRAHGPDTETDGRDGQVSAVDLAILHEILPTRPGGQPLFSHRRRVEAISVAPGPVGGGHD